MSRMLGFLYALAFLGLFTAPVGAQAVTVDFIEGNAAQRIGDTWAGLSIGDQVPVDSSIRLEKLSLLQLKGQGAVITLCQPGTYGLRGIVNARASLRATGAATAVAEAFSRILHDTGRGESSAGGVRAERMDLGNSLRDFDPRPYIESGKRSLVSGEYDTAIEQFAKAVKISPGGESGFCLATAYSLNGDPKAALTALAGVAPRGTDEWAPDLILLQAKLLEDTFAFEGAVKVLLAHRADLEIDAQRAQTWYFLLALGYRGTGEGPSSAACLDKVTSLAPETELAAAAERLRENP